jgi:hypothetical protein
MGYSQQVNSSVIALLAEHAGWGRSAAPRRERNAEDAMRRAEAPRSPGPSLFPHSPDHIEAVLSEGRKRVLSPPRPVRQSSRPSARESPRSFGSFLRSCCQSP